MRRCRPRKEGLADAGCFTHTKPCRDGWFRCAMSVRHALTNSGERAGKRAVAGASKRPPISRLVMQKSSGRQILMRGVRASGGADMPTNLICVETGVTLGRPPRLDGVISPTTTNARSLSPVPRCSSAADGAGRSESARSLYCENPGALGLGGARKCTTKLVRS
jgi:hypothetical protein